ncbi:MAG: class A beta-lactamase-related serine hydrolase [Burkholderiales bacterium]|nr:MAG: class A beta-lactamase-related serine hydrolase [Burkholderiales bacterium]
MKPFAALMALSLTATLVGAQTAPATPSRDALRWVDRWLQAQVEFDQVPGLSAAVVIGQDTVWSRGFGFSDHARRVPARADTLYSICSISKLFTSIAVMQQWEAGRLHLDDDIALHITDFGLKRSDAAGGPITIEALLTHSAGLPREGAQAYWTAPDFRFPSRERLLQDLKGQTSFMNAGERYQYSNLGMALLGEVVERRSGQPYAAYVQQHILGPLALKDTRPFMPRDQGDRLAQGFGARKRDGSRDPVPSFDTQGLAAAAGFTSSVLDLSRFAAWQFRLRKASQSEVLKPSTLRGMQRQHFVDADGTAVGLGFFVSKDGGKNVAGHSGWCPGQRSTLSLQLDDEIAVVLATNASDTESLSRYSRPIRQLLQKGLTLPAAKDAAALEAYAGEYESQPWTSATLVLPWGEDLATMDLPERDPAGALTVLKASGKDRFRAVRADGSLAEEWQFVRDAQGRVIAFEVWHQRVPKRVP